MGCQAVDCSWTPMLPLSHFCCSVCIQFALWHHFSWAHYVSGSVWALELFTVFLLANVTLNPMRVIMSSVAQTKAGHVVHVFLEADSAFLFQPGKGYLKQIKLARPCQAGDLIWGASGS